VRCWSLCIERLLADVYTIRVHKCCYLTNSTHTSFSFTSSPASYTECKSTDSTALLTTYNSKMILPDSDSRPWQKTMLAKLVDKQGSDFSRPRLLIRNDPTTPLPYQCQSLLHTLSLPPVSKPDKSLPLLVCEIRHWHRLTKFISSKLQRLTMSTAI
jgi:hypothetical protein